MSTPTTTSSRSSTSPSPDFTALADGFRRVVSMVAPAVLQVARRRGAGSATVWADDLIVTASAHTPDQPVVHQAGDDGVLVARAAHLVGRDPGTDLAVIRVEGGGLTVPSWGPLDEVGVGTLAVALGRPGRSVRASLRMIGVLGPAMRGPRGGALSAYVETDRLLPRGFAGGPLVDLRGQVLGLGTRTLVPGADVTVPTATVARVVAVLLADGSVRHGHLGVAAFPATVAGPAGPTAGALLVRVVDDGPAARGGLLVGDVVIRVGGQAVDGPDTLRAALWDQPGATTTVDLLRGGQAVSLEVALGATA